MKSTSSRHALFTLLFCTFFASACQAGPTANEALATSSEEASAEEPREEEPRAEGAEEAARDGVYGFTMQSITGQDVSLGEFQGQVKLFVNVASRCGFTRQYEGLQALWERYQGQGLVVLGFPANDFGNQEPGTDEEIQAFCENQFGVTFPMFSRISVVGPEQHPLYAYLTAAAGEEIAWNFNKILVDREGRVVAHFPSQVEPLSEEMVEAVEGLL